MKKTIISILAVMILSSCNLDGKDPVLEYGSGNSSRNTLGSKDDIPEAEMEGIQKLIDSVEDMR